MAQQWLGCNAHAQTVCGGTLVQDLGRVEWQRKTFHSESNIWPVGYRSMRFYASRRRARRPRAGAVAHRLQSQPGYLHILAMTSAIRDGLEESAPCPK